MQQLYTTVSVLNGLQFIGPASRIIKSPSSVLRGVRAKKLRVQQAGESKLELRPLVKYKTHIYLSRLLEVYGVLESVNAVNDAESVHYESLVTEYERLVHIISEDHVAAAELHIEDEDIRLRLIQEVRDECKEIIDYRAAAQRWHLEIDSRSKDRVISFGEKLSCRFVAALLQDRVSFAEPRIVSMC